MRRHGDVESEAECTAAKRRRGSRSAGADRSLCPNAQTKTHVSMSLSVAFCSPRPLHSSPVPQCMRCSERRASQLRSDMRPWNRWHARTRCARRRRARMGCDPCGHVCACRCATHAGACQEPLIRQRELHGSGACIVHSDGQRPAHRHTNACTSAANRHGAVAVRAHRGGVCAHTGDRVMWVRRGSACLLRSQLERMSFLFSRYSREQYSQNGLGPR